MNKITIDILGEKTKAFIISLNQRTDSIGNEWFFITAKLDTYNPNTSGDIDLPISKQTFIKLTEEFKDDV